MLKFRSLTNVRPSKDLGCQIICAPTSGQFKVTPEAAIAIGVANEDYLQILMDDSSGTAYAVKGVDGLGGKLAASNKAGAGLLTFSAANAWDELGGDPDFNTHYSVSVEDAIEDTDEEGNTRTYFPLTFVEKIEKQKRKSKGDGSDEDEDEDDDAVVADASGADFEEM